MAASTFQKSMTTTLAGLPGVQSHLDDVICDGTTQQDLDVLHALTDVGLKLMMHK